jgi:hypothetical protein
LLVPDLDPRAIEDVLKNLDVLGYEAPAEVAGGGGVGDAVAPKASRKTMSLRLSSMSSRQVPPQRAL